MQRIAHTLSAFQEAIKTHKPVVCTDEGTWKIERYPFYLARKFQNRDKERDLSVINVARRYLDDFEKIPIHCDEEHLAQQRTQFFPFIETAKIIHDRFRKCRFHECLKACDDLRRKILGIEYRLHGANNNVDEKLLKQLCQIAMEWKKRQIFFNKGFLSDREKQQLERACRYPEFVNLLFTNSIVRENFLKWALREHLNVDIFIQYPTTQQRLTLSYLDKRIGRLGSDGLKILTQPDPIHPWTTKKIVTLRIENQDINILDDQNTVALQNSYTLSLKDIFLIFRNKNSTPGHLEYATAGVLNWDSYRLGPWNPETKTVDSIDLNRPRWWEQLPIFKIIFPEEVQQQYGKSLRTGEYGIVACSSRSNLNLIPINTHAWIEILIPCKDGKGFQVFPFGKYPETFPKRWYQYGTFVVSTNKAQIQYPDENAFMTNRQQVKILFSMNDAQFDNAMAIIQKNILKAHKNNLIFQPLRDNCATWIQHILDKVLGTSNVPRLYDLVYHDLELFSIKEKVFKPFLKIKNKKLCNTSLKLFFQILGANRGLTIRKKGGAFYKCLSNSIIWNTAIMQNPAMLIHKVITGEFFPKDAE